MIEVGDESFKDIQKVNIEGTYMLLFLVYRKSNTVNTHYRKPSITRSRRS